MLTASLGRYLKLAVDGDYFIAGPFLRESRFACNVTYLGSWVIFVF